MSKKVYELKECEKKNSKIDAHTDTLNKQIEIKTEVEQPFEQEICDENPVEVKDIEIKTLSELIRDTLRDIKK